MSRHFILCSAVLSLLIGLALMPLPAGEATFDDGEIRHIGYPGWFKTSFLDFSADLQELDENKQGLMILFTTEGCSYCDQFIKRSLGNRVLARLVQDHFDSIGLEIFDDNEMTAPDGSVLLVKEYAKDMGVGFSPTLIFLDKNGEVVLKRVGYLSPDKFRVALDYVIGKNYVDSTYQEFLRTRAQPGKSSYVLKHDSIFASPPYMLDRSRIKAARPLIVLFEENGCQACARFHDQVLSDQEIRQVMARFEIVRLDRTDNKTGVITPAGEITVASAWYDQAGLIQSPSMLFFDEAGSEVLRTDALVLNQRMMNSLNYVLEKAYDKGWSYQRFARTKGMERIQKQNPAAD